MKVLTGMLLVSMLAMGFVSLAAAEETAEPQPEGCCCEGNTEGCSGECSGCDAESDCVCGEDCTCGEDCSCGGEVPEELDFVTEDQGSVDDDEESGYQEDLNCHTHMGCGGSGN